MTSHEYLMKNVVFSLRHPLVKLGLILLISSLLITVIATLLYLKPIYSERQDLLSGTKNLEQGILTSIEVDKFNNAYAEALTKVTTIETKLSANISQSMLINNVTKLAEKRKIKIFGESYQEGKVNNSIKTFYQEISLQGTYSGLKAFLYDLNGLDSWTEISETRLDASNDRKDVKAVIKLVTYHKL